MKIPSLLSISISLSCLWTTAAASCVVELENGTRLQGELTSSEDETQFLLTYRGTRTPQTLLAEEIISIYDLSPLQVQDHHAHYAQITLKDGSSLQGNLLAFAEDIQFQLLNGEEGTIAKEHIQRLEYTPQQNSGTITPHHWQSNQDAIAMGKAALTSPQDSLSYLEEIPDKGIIEIVWQHTDPLAEKQPSFVIDFIRTNTDLSQSTTLFQSPFSEQTIPPRSSFEIETEIPQHSLAFEYNLKQGTIQCTNGAETSSQERLYLYTFLEGSNSIAIRASSVSKPILIHSIRIYPTVDNSLPFCDFSNFENSNGIALIDGQIFSHYSIKSFDNNEFLLQDENNNNQTIDSSLLASWQNSTDEQNPETHPAAYKITLDDGSYLFCDHFNFEADLLIIQHSLLGEITLNKSFFSQIELL